MRIRQQLGSQTSRQLGDRMHYELMVLASTLYTYMGKMVVSKNECAEFKGRDQFRFPESTEMQKKNVYENLASRNKIQFLERKNLIQFRMCTQKDLHSPQSFLFPIRTQTHRHKIRFRKPMLVHTFKWDTLLIVWKAWWYF